MANNADFLKIVIKDVTFHWPRLDQPYRYNSAEKRTEACSAGAPNAGYSIAFDMPTDEAKKLHGELKKHYQAAKARNPKLPEFTSLFGMKRDDETGTVRFTAKKRAMSNDGKVNKPPRVVDGALKDLEDKAIWSGSKGSLRLLAFPTTDPDGKGGISLLLDVVQVTDAQYGSDGIEDDFDVVAPAARSMDDLANAPAQEANVPEDAEW